jgi:hypothetical protein
MAVPEWIAAGDGSVPDPHASPRLSVIALTAAPRTGRIRPSHAAAAFRPIVVFRRF